MNHIEIETEGCGVILAPKDSVVLHKYEGHYRMMIVSEGVWRAVSAKEYGRVDESLTFEAVEPVCYMTTASGDMF